MKRTDLKRATYRQLQPGEQPPQGEPKRYIEGRGYVRLRWKVGPQQYVETYEHRLVAGVPPTDVHHRDHIKGNNDLTNLVALSRVAHAEEHGREMARASKRETLWGGARSRQAFEKREAAKERRADRQRFLAEIAAMYAAGQSTVEIGTAVGRGASNISRALRATGVVTRPARNRRAAEVSSTTRQRIHARARLRCECCGKNLAWTTGQCHHRTPRGMGGSSMAELGKPSNIVYLCDFCHDWIESNRTEATPLGWLVPHGVDPATVSVPLFDGRRVLLNEHGEYEDALSEADR